MAFSTSHDNIAGLGDADTKPDGLASIRDTEKGLFFHSCMPLSAPAAISSKIPSSDSVRGSSAVRMLISANCGGNFCHHTTFLFVPQPCRTKNNNYPLICHVPDRLYGYPQCIGCMSKIDNGGERLAKINPFHAARYARSTRQYHERRSPGPHPDHRQPRSAQPGSSRH